MSANPRLKSHLFLLPLLLAFSALAQDSGTNSSQHLRALTNQMRAYRSDVEARCALLEHVTSVVTDIYELAWSLDERAPRTSIVSALQRLDSLDSRVHRFPATDLPVSEALAYARQALSDPDASGNIDDTRQALLAGVGSLRSAVLDITRRSLEETDEVAALEDEVRALRSRLAASTHETVRLLLDSSCRD